jgi:predicted RNase H-like nuclease (RuvC/YqgF family)
LSAAKPSPSQISAMSGRTYISSLQNQLQEEKEARLKLEKELEELKKISSEITS